MSYYKPFKVTITYSSCEGRKETLFYADYRVEDYSILHHADEMMASIGGELQNLSDRKLTDEDCYVPDEPEDESEDESEGLDPLSQYLDWG